LLVLASRRGHHREGATAIDPHLYILFGGLHQIQAPDPEVERIATVLHDQYKLERVAPGHCTASWVRRPERHLATTTFTRGWVSG